MTDQNEGYCLCCFLDGFARMQKVWKCYKCKMDTRKNSRRTLPTGCHWTRWAKESRSSGLLQSPCGAFRRGAWQRVITHTHTLCTLYVCLFASRRAGRSILQGCNQGRLCNQYHHSGLENVLRAHSTLCRHREREREDGGNIWLERTTNAGRGSANGCKSQQARKQTALFSHLIQNGSDSALSPHRLSLPLHHWLLALSIIQLEAHWLSCESGQTSCKGLEG